MTTTTLVDAVQQQLEEACRRVATLREMERLALELDGESGGGSANGDRSGVGQQAATPAAGGAPPAPPAARRPRTQAKPRSKPKTAASGRALPSVDELAPRVLEQLRAHAPLSKSGVRRALGMNDTTAALTRIDETLAMLERRGDIEPAGTVRGGGKAWAPKSRQTAETRAAVEDSARAAAGIDPEDDDGEDVSAALRAERADRERAADPPDAGLTIPEQRIVATLEHRSMTIQELAAEHDAHPAHVAQVTGPLERRGVIVKGPGGKYQVIHR